MNYEPDNIQENGAEFNQTRETEEQAYADNVCRQQPTPPDYTTMYYAQPPIEHSNPNECQGMAIASMVLGIVGIVACCCCGMGVVAAIVGLILGIVARSRGNRQAFSLVGIILCSVAIVIGVLFAVVYWAAVLQELEIMMTDPDFDYYDYMEDYYNQLAFGLRRIFK